MLLPDSMGYITRATIIRRASAQLLKNPDGGFQLYLHGVPQEVCIIVSPLRTSKFCRAEPTGQGASCCYQWAATVLAITLNSYQSDMCQTMLPIHNENLWLTGKNWYIEEFCSTRQIFFLIKFFMQINFVMPMEREMGK